jgi:hypothetical protein
MLRGNLWIICHSPRSNKADYKSSVKITRIERKYMRLRSLVISATLISVLVLALAVIIIAADDPFVGTWKLDVAKSKLPGPPPKSDILKITADANTYKWAFETVDQEGKTANAVWSGTYDGKPHPYKGNADSDSIISKRTDANTLDVSFMKGGKAVGTGQSIVSKDGKTLTLISKVKNTQGQEAATSSVYNRQSR